MGKLKGVYTKVLNTVCMLKESEGFQTCTYLLSRIQLTTCVLYMFQIQNGTTLH